MPEILTYNTPGSIEREKTKQPFYRSFFDWFNSKDKFTKLYLITFALIIIATPFITSQYLNYLQHAASHPSGSVETEDATLSGSVSIGSDTNASGGKYIQFGASSITGTTYYVDCNAGNDSDAGTSTAAAWQSLRKASSAALNPGDGLLLKRGCTWSDALTSDRGGTDSRNIIVGTY